MRGLLTKALSIVAIAIAAAGCQSPGSAVGALQPMAYTTDMLAAPVEPMPQSAPLPASASLAAAPAGFISFCLRFADQCTAPAGTASNVVATAAVWQTLNQVNATVNTAISPQDDLDHYGRPEFWTIPTDGYGDCDDYALTKRQALIAAGLPELALRVAVVRTPDGSRHAVLTVSTDRGDFVLDNLRPAVLPWSETGYTWIERQAANNPWNWVALQSDGNAPQTAVAQTSEPAAASTPPDAPKLQPGFANMALLGAPTRLYQVSLAAPIVTAP